MFLTRAWYLTFDKKLKSCVFQRIIELSKKNIRVISQYTNGACFGEGALLSKDSRRGATIKCVHDCYLGVLSKDAYELTIGKI